MRTTFAIFCILLLGTLAHAAVTARAGKYTVAITAQPAVPASGDNLFVLTVTDGGQPLTGAAVAVHADMTSMSMPVDAVAAPGRTPGEYGATVPLAMAGAWTLDVAVHQMAGMTMDGDGTAHFLVKTGSGITTVTQPPVNAPALTFSRA